MLTTSSDSIIPITDFEVDSLIRAFKVRIMNHVRWVPVRVLGSKDTGTPVYTTQGFMSLESFYFLPSR